mmetsp:Transcript_37220/g.58822  ORF Transcript_37220/g.58822 Transcript_37220/m.58822 type:complete len:143 (+) Transcript_37220:70-498(+)
MFIRWMVSLGIASFLLGVEGSEHSVRRHAQPVELEISASGVAKSQIYMRREASDEAEASTAEAQDDCTGLKVATACSNADVNASAASCESYKAPKGAAFFRCSWKRSEPNHGDEPGVPAACLLDEKAGVCGRLGDSSVTRST